MYQAALVPAHRCLASLGFLTTPPEAGDCGQMTIDTENPSYSSGWTQITKLNSARIHVEEEYSQLCFRIRVGKGWSAEALMHPLPTPASLCSPWTERDLEKGLLLVPALSEMRLMRMPEGPFSYNQIYMVIMVKWHYSQMFNSFINYCNWT